MCKYWNVAVLVSFDRVATAFHIFTLCCCCLSSSSTKSWFPSELHWLVYKDCSLLSLAMGDDFFWAVTERSYGRWRQLRTMEGSPDDLGSLLLTEQWGFARCWTSSGSLPKTSLQLKSAPAPLWERCWSSCFASAHSTELSGMLNKVAWPALSWSLKRLHGGNNPFGPSFSLNWKLYAGWFVAGFKRPCWCVCCDNSWQGFVASVLRGKGWTCGEDERPLVFRSLDWQSWSVPCFGFLRKLEASACWRASRQEQPHLSLWFGCPTQLAALSGEGESSSMLLTRPQSSSQSWSLNCDKVRFRACNGDIWAETLGGLIPLDLSWGGDDSQHRLVSCGGTGPSAGELGCCLHFLSGDFVSVAGPPEGQCSRSPSWKTSPVRSRRRVALVGLTRINLMASLPSWNETEILTCNREEKGRRKRTRTTSEVLKCIAIRVFWWVMYYYTSNVFSPIYGS